MGKTLNVCVKDMNTKRSNDSMCCPRKLSLFEDFSKGSPKMSDTRPFTASKGWLNGFRKRLGLKTIKITGEAASVYKEAAAPFLAELKKLIKEKGYLLKQVFSFNETRLFSKMMLNRTHIDKSAKEASGHKTWKDRLTLVQCSNAGGHMIKT